MDIATLLPLAIRTSILLTVLGLGLNARWQDALYVFRNPPLLARSVLSMNILMPLLAAALVVAFDLPDAVEIALVAIALSPVPPILPNKELKAGGHASYAIGLLVAIAVLAIVIVPVGVSAFSGAFHRSGTIAPLAVAKIMLTSILAPLAVGIALRQWLPALAKKAAGPILMVGTVLLIVSVLPLLYASWPNVRGLIGNGTVLILAAMAAIGLAIGHLLGGPASNDRTVLALSTASRHPAVALSIAVSGGAASKQELAAILLYLVMAGLVSLPYVLWRKRQASQAVAALRTPQRSLE